DPKVTKSEFRVSFHVTPGFSLRKGSPAESPARPMKPATGTVSSAQPLLGNSDVRPIEPGSSGSGLRVVLILAACAAAALVLWFLTRAHGRGFRRSTNERSVLAPAREQIRHQHAEGERVRGGGGDRQRIAAERDGAAVVDVRHADGGPAVHRPP